MRISECPECVEHYLAPEQRFLIEACTSVGVERGMSTLEMLRHYMSVYHFGGHRFDRQGVLLGAARTIRE